MKKLFKITTATVFCLSFALALAACGDAATAVPATTTSAAAAATTTVAAATTANASNSTSSSASLSVPDISNAKEIALSPDMTTFIAQSIGPSLGLSASIPLKYYGSSDDVQTFGTNIDKALTGAGYAFGIPGQSGMIKSSDGLLGVYTKSGSPDLLVAVQDSASASSSSLPAGVTAPKGFDQFISQIKATKSAGFVISADGIAAKMAQSMGGAANPAPTTK